VTSQGPDATYFAYLEARDWRLQRCTACGAHVFQPRVMCPSCGADDFEWVAPSGHGTVHSTTVIRRRPERGGDYNVCLVDLAEGVRMMSRVEGLAPTDVAIGMAVTARLAEQDGQTVVVFDPAEGAGQ
jgi:uncharacterized OB-fold protein